MTSYFPSFSAFLHMGGYASYVWSAYGIALLILLGHFTVAKRRLHLTIKQLKKYVTKT